MPVRKAVKKAQRRPVKKAQKATVPPVVKKKKKKKETPVSHIIFNSIAETLEHNSLGGGEYDLPSVLTRQLEKSHPDYKLGLHREYYIPLNTTPSYHRTGEPMLMTLMKNQASIALPAFGEGIKIKKIDDPNIPLCRECK